MADKLKASISAYAKKVKAEVAARHGTVLMSLDTSDILARQGALKIPRARMPMKRPKPMWRRITLKTVICDQEFEHHCWTPVERISKQAAFIHKVNKTAKK